MELKRSNSERWGFRFQGVRFLRLVCAFSSRWLEYCFWVYTRAAFFWGHSEVPTQTPVGDSRAVARVFFNINSFLQAGQAATPSPDFGPIGGLYGSFPK